MATRNYIIQAADECLKILFLLGMPEFVHLSEQEIMNASGLSKDRTFRILKTLENSELVRKSKGRWGIAPTIIKFSDGFRRHLANKRAEIEDQEMEYLGV